MIEEMPRTGCLLPGAIAPVGGPNSQIPVNDAAAWVPIAPSSPLLNTKERRPNLQNVRILGFETVLIGEFSKPLQTQGFFNSLMIRLSSLQSGSSSPVSTDACKAAFTLNGGIDAGDFLAIINPFAAESSGSKKRSLEPHVELQSDPASEGPFFV